MHGEFNPVEYKVVDCEYETGDEMESKFNALGQEGWEFVTWDDVGRAIFKRG